MPTSRRAPTTAERAGAGSSADGRRAAQGVTLLELLLVMAIVASLLGIGVGAFSRLATPERIAAGQLLDAVRGARQLARAANAPAAVVVDPVAGDVYAVGQAAVGNWHFESLDGAGWPVPASHEGAALDPLGIIGSALDLRTGEGLVVRDLPPGADSPAGFGLDGWWRPLAEPRPMTLLERPGVFRLALDEEDRLEVTVHLVSEPHPEEFRRTCEGVHLPADRFTRLSVTCDGRTLHVAVDGATVGVDTAFERPRAVATAPGVALWSGERLALFRGWLDELRLASVRALDHRPLPPEVQLDGPARILRLDAFGRLDAAFHGGPERIGFVTGEPPFRAGVEVGLFGHVEAWSERP